MSAGSSRIKLGKEVGIQSSSIDIELTSDCGVRIDSSTMEAGMLLTVNQ